MTKQYFRINLTQEVSEDLYTEKYKMLINKIEGNTNKLKDYMSSWIGRLISLKCPYYPKQSTD
jgi:hypothetical protein